MRFVCESLCVVVCFVLSLCVDGCICVVLFYTCVCVRFFVHYCVKLSVLGCLLSVWLGACVCLSCCAKHLWLCVVFVIYGGVSYVMLFGGVVGACMCAV